MYAYYVFKHDIMYLNIMYEKNKKLCFRYHTRYQQIYQNTLHIYKIFI